MSEGYYIAFYCGFMSEFILHYVSENRYFVPGASEKILQYTATNRYPSVLKYPHKENTG